MKDITNLPVPRIVVAIVDEYLATYRTWKDGDHLLYLGEIDNMPGHGAFVTRDGVVHWGYHPDEFREPTEEEL